MSSGLDLIDSVPDDFGDEIEVQVHGGTVLLGLPENITAVAFANAAQRDRFARAWAEAERRAEAHEAVSG